MALFVEADLPNVNVRICRNVDINDVHSHWMIVVEDENNKLYRWKDVDLACDCDDANLTAAIEAKLITLEKKTGPAPVARNISTSSRDTIVGNNLGA